MTHNQETDLHDINASRGRNRGRLAATWFVVGLVFAASFSEGVAWNAAEAQQSVPRSDELTTPPQTRPPQP